MARGAKGDFGRASPELLEGLKVGQLRAMYTIKGMEEKYSRFEEREAKYDVEVSSSLLVRLICFSLPTRLPLSNIANLFDEGGRYSRPGWSH